MVESSRRRPRKAPRTSGPGGSGPLIASVSSLALLSLLLAPQSSAPAKSEPAPLQTVAERTGYQRTASHAEVMEFLVQLQDLGAPIEVADIGTTTGGKPLPLVIA